MKLKTLLFIFCGTLLIQTSFSQVGKIKSATKKYKNLEYVQSKEVLLDLANKEDPPAEVIEKLANVYYFNSEMEDASKWYEELINLKKENKIDSLDAENYFRYAQALKAQEKYKEADAVLNDFVALNPDEIRAKAISENSDYLTEIDKISKNFVLENIDVNTTFSDFGSSLYKGTLIFASSRDTDEKLYGWNGQPFLNLFEIDSVGNVKEFNKEINSKYHESTATFTKDGKTLYFTRNNYHKGKFKKSSDNTHVVQIFKAELVDGTWTNIEPLPFNSHEFNVAHPALSLDERKLYFASDMPGTFGGSDLFVVDINEDGTYGTPINLGESINTEGRENFPFISEKNNLYFSSNGHIGLGGLDVFKVPVNDIGKASIENVGKPINGPKDDFGYVIFETTGSGYISSNRAGGKGDDDIYKFKTPECKPVLQGIVVDKYSKEIISEAKVVLYDVDKNIITSFITDELGTFTYNLDCVKQGYKVEAEKETYFPDNKEFTMTTNITQIFDLTLELESIPAPVGTDLTELLSLNPIYFDFDESVIRPDAKEELAKVIEYMQKYPTVKIDVRSHTDSWGPEIYNIGLSERRNKSTKEYIIEKGNISSERLSGKGYGESELTNGCTDDVPCSKDSHQANRRSEFIIIEN